MLAVTLTLFFIVAGLAIIGVLTASYARGLAAFGELRSAAAGCDEMVTVTMRMIDHRLPQLRVVSSTALRPQPQPALRAAA